VLRGLSLGGRPYAALSFLYNFSYSGPLVRIEPHTMRGGAHLGLTVLPLV
jgi:hypothetical protein